MGKIYSGIADIPKGTATERLISGCLVLEGGAFRGLYTQGVLDSLMLNGIMLSCVVGVSAGALSGANYVSGQIGRSARINLTYRHDSRYVGARAMIHSHSFLDIGFLTEDRGILESLDEDRFFRPEQRFIAAATNLLTGETTYFEKGCCADIMLAIKASATMPYISPPVEIEGVPYLDGGCSCKIPYEWALEQGYEKILIVRTRDSAFRSQERRSSTALRAYRRHPEFAEKLAGGRMEYNRQCDEIARLGAEGRLLQIAPSRPVTVGRVEKDMEKLGELYWLGYRDCEESMEKIRRYLGC